MNLRSRKRTHTRSLSRHTSRMLGGLHRPRPPDYLAMACRALRQIAKIDKSLRPFMKDQVRMVEDWLRSQEIAAVLRKVYSQPPVNGKISVNKR